MGFPRDMAANVVFRMAKENNTIDFNRALDELVRSCGSSR